MIQGIATRRSSLSVLLMVILGAIGPSPSEAQERKGFWGSVGIGAVGDALSVDADSAIRAWPGREWSVSLSELAIGWALNPRLLAGLEMKGSTGTLGAGTEVDFALINLSGALWFYPTASNFFVKGGLGGSFLEASADVRGSRLSETHSGLAVTTGAGYDVFLGRGFSLTPAVGFWYGRPGELRLAGRTFASGWAQNAVDVSLSIKFN